MIEINDFYNDGTGWKCRPCELELDGQKNRERSHSRFFTEGESESNTLQLASPALAKWFDAARETLICPRCGLTERVYVN